MAAAQEIVREALGAFTSSWPLVLGLGVLALGLVALEGRSRGRAGWARGIFPALLAGGLSFGLYRAWQILWIADDAFISFRYARNWVRGWGLVYNEGEWVEGYTNFLWTFLLAVLGKVGLDIPLTALFGNLVAFALALVVVALASRKIGPSPQVVPFAALALAATTPFITFAGSGLETMPLALFVALAIWAGTKRRGEVWASLALTASVLCRPDQILLWGAMGLALVLEDLVIERGHVFRRLRFRRYLTYLAPFLLVFVPYFLLRWRAYGDVFPNTFYVKSGAGAYWSQGLVYLTHFISATGAWLWIPLFIASLFGAARSRDELRLRFFAILSFAVLGTYVVRVGGDFMEYRFFVPLLPIIGIATESSIRWRLANLPSRRLRVAWAGAAAASLAVAWVPIHLIRPFEIRWHLAAEPTFYQVETLWPLRIANGHFDSGNWLNEVFVQRGLLPRMSGGAIGMVGYYSDLPLFDVMGLTSRSIAHKKVRKRSRPGHEKRASIEEIVEDGVVIDLNPVWGVRWQHATKGQVDGHVFHFLRYPSELVQELSSVKNAKLPNPKKDIEGLVEAGSREEVLEALGFYSHYLSDWEEREVWLEKIRARLASIADFEEGLPDGAEEEGGIFSVSRHEPPRGASGLGWLSSVNRPGRGSLSLRFRIESDELRFALGGYASEQLGVDLIVDGELVRAARPTGAPGLSPVSWMVHDLVGKNAELVIFDRDVRPGVGVEVDGIHFAASSRDIRKRIREAGNLGALLREAEQVLPLEDPDRLFVSSRIEERISLDLDFPEGTAVDGDAFSAGPLSAGHRSQGLVRGALGPGFLSSFQPGDHSLGRVAFPERILSGEPIHVLVGGGAHCARVYVGLEVEGKIKARVCGKDDEVLRPASIDAARWKGRRGRVVVVDESSEGWGHILVDDIVFERSVDRQP